MTIANTLEIPQFVEDCSISITNGLEILHLVQNCSISVNILELPQLQQNYVYSNDWLEILQLVQECRGLYHILRQGFTL